MCRHGSCNPQQCLHWSSRCRLVHGHTHVIECRLMLVLASFSRSFFKIIVSIVLSSQFLSSLIACKFNYYNYNHLRHEKLGDSEHLCVLVCGNKIQLDWNETKGSLQHLLHANQFRRDEEIKKTRQTKIVADVCRNCKPRWQSTSSQLKQSLNSMPMTHLTPCLCPCCHHCLCAFDSNV